MSLVVKDNNVLYHKKEAVVTTPLSEKKLLINDKVKNSDEVHKRTNKITRSEKVVKSTDKVHKRT